MSYLYNLSTKLGKVTLMFYATVMCTGCAGMKITSQAGGYDKIIERIPSQREIAIRIKSDLSATLTDFFIITLTKELEKRDLFSKLTIIQNENFVKTSLCMDIEVGFSAAGKVKRIMGYGQSMIAVTGTISDISQNKMLFRFVKTRRGMGGLFGVGGWLAPNEETMCRNLVQWVISDTVTVLSKEVQ